MMALSFPRRLVIPIVSSALLFTLSFSLTMLFFPSRANSFAISPFIAELRPSGVEASKTFTVENRYDRPIAVQITLKKREQAADGQETRTDTEDLIASPEQLSLKAGEKRLVRITYVGNRELKEELAYRAIFEQLPVDLAKPEKDAKTGAKFQFVFNYVASVYVAPAGAVSELVIESTKVLDDGNVEIELRNKGRAHQQLSELELTLVDEGSPAKVYGEWDKATLETLSMANVLAGQTRRLKLKLPKGVPSGAGVKSGLKAVLKKKL
jgi:fimbrial chaperone protein